MNMEKIVHWTANVVGVVGIISGLILMFYRERSGIYYTTKPNVGLGISCIISSIVLVVILYSVADILYCNRKQIELLEDLVKNTKND